MASACTALTGIAKDCLNNLGGIQQLLINDIEDIVSVTIVSGEVTSIGLDALTPIYFQEFQVTRDSSTLAHTMEVDVTAGSTLYTQTLTASFKKQDIDKRLALLSMAEGQRDLVALVQDNNGQWWLGGYAEDFVQGLQLTGGESTLGTAKADMNGYVVELSNQFPTRPIPVDSAVIATILTP